MNPIITEHREAIFALCRAHGVKLLEVFGSVLRDDFDPVTSDIDFLVEFQDLTSPDIADAYFGLKFSLEELLGRPVDLVSSTAIRNPYFRAAIDKTRTPLYAA